MPDNEMVWVPKGALTDIGDAIREKLGVASTYKLDEMPDAIGDIGGGGLPLGIAVSCFALNDLGMSWDNTAEEDVA